MNFASRSLNFASASRHWRRGPAKVAYGLLQRMTGRGRLRPWLDCTVMELFEAGVDKLKRSSRLPNAFTVREAGPNDADELGRFFGRPAQVEKRLGRGDACLITLAGGQVAAGAWLALGPATIDEDWPDLRCVYRIPAGVAWGYDGRGTKPGAWGALMARMPAFLESLGAGRTIAAIHYNNHLSMDSHRSLGYHSLGWVACIRLFGLTILRYRPLEGRWQRLPGHLGPVDLLTAARSTRQAT